MVGARVRERGFGRLEDPAIGGVLLGTAIDLDSTAFYCLGEVSCVRWLCGVAGLDEKCEEN